MQTQNILIAHPTTTDQLNALKAVVKALKVKFELKKENLQTIPEKHKNIVRERIKNSKASKLLDWDLVKNDFDGI